jgi:hypothetical protein
MSTLYTETPDNYSDIISLVLTDTESIKKSFFDADRVIFYDACSFQKHSNLADKEKQILINYFNNHNTMICITRCVLMELTSDYHLLTEYYIDYIKKMHAAKIRIAVFDEEYVYDILSACFSSNEKINEYLVWAIRMVNSPVSTIKIALKDDKRLYSEAIEAKNLKQSDLYSRFFTAVRGNKEHADNLGEELIAICVHILSYLPGISDGKLCVLTDDKGAASKIDSTIKRTNLKKRGARIILFSTPKLVQHMYKERIPMSEDEMKNIISQGTSGKIAVMGITAYDLSVNEKISLESWELVKKITEPNGIDIVF